MSLRLSTSIWLVLAAVVAWSSHAMPPTEFRGIGLQRFGEYVAWSESFEKFPKVIPTLQQTGTLSALQVGLIDNIQPYPLADGHAGTRPMWLDDLYYESLMLQDPVEGTERMYPLVARAYRVPSDWSFVVFELQPDARFQDGRPVTAADVAFSYDILLHAEDPTAVSLAESVRDVVLTGEREIRFDLNVTGQEARDVIMRLAALKVVRPNRQRVRRIGGIRVPYLATGPYRLTRLGPEHFGLIKDPFYWGVALNTRKGFFNFRTVDISAYPTPAAARAALGAPGTPGFYAETGLVEAPRLARELKEKKVALELIQEPALSFGRPMAGFSFDLRRPRMRDLGTRQALLLLYDYDGVNRTDYGGQLKRPPSLLDESRIPIVGFPSPAVRQRKGVCDLPAHAFQAFEGYGNNHYSHLGDRRVRLLTALRSLQEVGYRQVDGHLERPGPVGTERLEVHALVRTSEQARQMSLYRDELRQLGIPLSLTMIRDYRSFREEAARGDYDLVASEDFVTTADRWPREDLLFAVFHPLAVAGLPCLDQLLADLRRESPMGEGYRSTSEALARIQQVLYLNIFTGQPSVQNFFLDPRIQVPAGLSVERAHMYGYWRN